MVDAHDEGEVEDLQDAFDRGEYVDLSHSSVSAVFQVLQNYLNSLPESLILNSLYGDIQRAAGM